MTESEIISLELLLERLKENKPDDSELIKSADEIISYLVDLDIEEAEPGELRYYPTDDPEKGKDIQNERM